MEERKPIYFKDYIRKMLLSNAIAPVLLISFLGLGIFFSVWRYSIINTNQQELQLISNKISEMIEEYDSLMNRMANKLQQPEILNNKSEQVAIYEDLYSVSNQLGYRGKLYIFDNKGNTLLPEGNELPNYLSGLVNTNWGIFRLMNQELNSVQLKLVQELDEDKAYILLGKAIVQEEEIKGYIVISINSLELKTLISTSLSKIIITDKQGWVYYTDSYEFTDKLHKIKNEFAEQNGPIRLENNRYYISKQGLAQENLMIYVVSNMSNQVRYFLFVSIVIVLLLLLMLIFLIQSAKRLANKSTKDIYCLADAFEEVQNGNLNATISINSSREFEKIGNSYNMMLDSLKEQIETNKEMVESVAFAQIKQLESQFNPHFMFNTLENIRVMCKIDPIAASNMIVELSSLLRYSISGAEEEITVREDLKNTQNYLSLLKVRFNRRFVYQVTFDENILDFYIPKLLIQPLIENAIKYGFGERECLKVEVTGYQQGDTLIFTCKDDGVGIEEETLNIIKETLEQAKNNSGHLGLYNVHRRIKLKYKGDYGIFITSNKEVHVRIRTHPFIRRDQSECR